MQHPTPQLLAHEMFDSLRRWTGRAWAGEELPVDATVAAMDEAGVDIGLLSAWASPEGWLITNDQVAEVCRRYPQRLVGVGSVDLRRPMDAVREVRRCVEELCFRAIRVIPWLWNLPPNDRRYYPVYVACLELDVPFCLQVGHAGPLRPSEPGRPIPYLDDVALEFPDLRIVAGHIGFPWTAEMISLATKYPNVFIDTSAYTVRRYPSELMAYLRGHGRHKVLFGSNYPMISPARCLEHFDDLGLDDETTGLFLSGNARRVFGLAAAGAV